MNATTGAPDHHQQRSHHIITPLARPAASIQHPQNRSKRHSFTIVWSSALRHVASMFRASNAHCINSRKTDAETYVGAWAGGGFFLTLQTKFPLDSGVRRAASTTVANCQECVSMRLCVFLKVSWYLSGTIFVCARPSIQCPVCVRVLGGKLPIGGLLRNLFEL